MESQSVSGTLALWTPLDTGLIAEEVEWACRKVVDLICTLGFSVLVLVTTIRMLRDVLEVLMESTPRAINATQVQR